MARVRVRLNHRGMAELLRSTGVGDDMMRRADRVVQQARTNAPVVTGTYRRELRTERIKRSDRTVARAVAPVEYAQKIEAKYRVLGRAIDAARG